jgi:hypothetical protein
MPKSYSSGFSSEESDIFSVSTVLYGDDGIYVSSDDGFAAESACNICGIRAEESMAIAIETSFLNSDTCFFFFSWDASDMWVKCCR